MTTQLLFNFTKELNKACNSLETLLPRLKKKRDEAERGLRDQQTRKQIKNAKPGEIIRFIYKSAGSPCGWDQWYYSKIDKAAKEAGIDDTWRICREEVSTKRDYLDNIGTTIYVIIYMKRVFKDLIVVDEEGNEISKHRVEKIITY